MERVTLERETSFSWRVRWLAASPPLPRQRRRVPTSPSCSQAAIAGGVDMVQVRAKGMTDRELLPHLETARAVTRRFDIPLRRQRPR